MHGRAGARALKRPRRSVSMDVGRSARRHAIGLACLLAVVPTGRLVCQDTTRTDTTHMILPADTMPPGVRPMGAFLRSFVLPGWGQAVTDRPMTGAVFVSWEGVSAMM